MTAQLVVLAALILPSFMFVLAGMRPPRRDVLWSSHLRALSDDVRLATLETVFNIAFLADRARRQVDAIVRSLWRMGVSRRHLLEWTTAAQSARIGPVRLLGFYREMGAATLIVTLAAIGAVFVTHRATGVVPLAALWLIAPAIAAWAGRPSAVKDRKPLDLDEQRELRLIARRTWRFFETYVTPDQQMLPPDNFQEDPKPVIAARTSPTNIGLYLLSTVAARDFGWIGTEAAVARLEATFATLHRLETFNGHLFNWYGTSDLRVLDPRYVSSVDSGNLAGPSDRPGERVRRVAHGLRDPAHRYRSPRRAGPRQASDR